MVAQLLGGIGLFLLGMALLTDGLRDLAGDSLRTLLARFTGGPVSAMLSGALLTTIVQSSSATTLATIGFVSAGLLGLPQAIAVIIGANIGTTTTAWLVSLVGLKFSVSVAGLPLVGLGALLRVLGRERLVAVGSALAGFGLVFVGIDTMQLGMAELATRVDPHTLPGATPLGRLLLVAIGAVMTVLMQSSSAAVATTLAAVHAGSVSLAQAAALVIGQNIGTTATALIGAIGASVPARRAAFSHVAFNVGTALVALAIFPLFFGFVVDATEQLHARDPASTIALFHTSFNVLGVIIFLPLVRPLARFVTWAVRDRGSELTRFLDPSVAHVPAVAVEAAHRSLAATCGLLADGVVRLAEGATSEERHEAVGRFVEVESALTEIRDFLGHLRSHTESAEVHASHIDALHAVDHIERVIDACRSAASLMSQLGEDGLGPAYPVLDLIAAESNRLKAWGDGQSDATILAGLELASRTVAGLRQKQRADVIGGSADGAVSVPVAMRQLDLLLALEKAMYSMWRAVFHLQLRTTAAASVSPVQASANPGSP